MKTKIFLSLCLAGSLGITAQTQKKNVERCSVLSHEEQLQQQNPNRKAEREAYNAGIQNFIQNNPNLRQGNQTQSTLTIPVVVHVVYSNATQNISNAQVQSQITVLNQDFNRTNADASQTPTLFQPKAAGANLNWCLAQIDPNGNPTTGIVRKQTTNTAGWIDDDKVKFASSQGDDAWPTTQYFNIWVCDLGSQLLGYGEFPTGSPTNTYGLVCNYTCFGNTGTAAAPYDLGRTSTHEVGHCLNLYHIWGDEPQCAQDDGVADTPKQKAENYGTPTFPQGTSASGGCCTASDQSSMYMNYMDYTDDAGMNMFTQGQVTDMLAVLSTAPYNALTTSNKCSSSTNIQQLLQNEFFSVYPNPGKGVFNINMAGAISDNASLTVKNLLGETVKTITLNLSREISVDLSTFSSGVYFIELQNEGLVSRKKIILEKE